MTDDDTKPFPIQDEWSATTHSRLKSSTIPWWLAEVAYDYYAERFGKEQSLERLAERGGFGWSEIPYMTKKYMRSRKMGSPWPKIKEENEDE